MDYSRTMNKIIFDKYLEDYNELSDPMYPKQLIIPTTTIKPVPYYGMIPLERAKGAKLMWMTEWNNRNCTLKSKRKEVSISDRNLRLKSERPTVRNPNALS